MTTHLRARGFQAGAFLALIGGLLVVTPAPALADAPTVIIDGPTSINLKAGERVGLNYSVTNPNKETVSDDSVTVTVSISIGELRCEGTCGVTEKIAPGQSTSHSITLVAGTVPSGQTRDGKVEIKADLGGQSSSTSRSATVRGDDKPPTVTQVGGKLRDKDKKAVADADVYLSDSASHQYTAKTNGSGSFRFFSSDQAPIAPGLIIVGAQKSGLIAPTAQKVVEAGKSATIDLTMASTAAPPSASVTPSPSLNASAAPTEEVTDDETVDAPAPALTAAGGAQSQDSGSSTLLLVLGGLLVAAGVGAIVLLIMRRRSGAKNKSGPDTDAPAPRPGGAAVPAPSSYDATRIAAAGPTPTRVGTPAVNPAEATMVTTAALPPSLSNAPTLMQQAVVDEYPDPYGAPAAVPHAGYVAAAAQAAAPAPPPPTPPTVWGAGGPGTGPYGAAVPQARPVPGPAAPAAGMAVPYVQPGGVPYVQPGGYVPADQQQRYDEPTGLWNPQNDAYPDDGGYPQVDEHGQPVDDYPANGNQDGGFDPATGYAAHYAPQAGYDQAGYPPEGNPATVGYGHDAGYVSAGHHAPAAGQQPGGYPVPHQQQAHDATAPYQAGGDGYAAAGDSYGSWNQPAEGLDHGGAYGGGYAPEGDYRAAAPTSYDETTGYAPRAAHQQAADAPAGYGRPEGYGSAPAQPGRATPQGRAPQGRPVPVHHKPTPGQPTPGQPTPGRPAPGRPAPGRPAPGQPMAGQPMQGRPAPVRAPQGRPAPSGPLQGGGPPVHGQAAPGRPAVGRPAPGPGGQVGPNGQAGHSAPTHGGPAAHGGHTQAQGHTTPTGVRVEFDQPNDYYGGGEESAPPQVGRHGAPAAPAQSTRPGQRRQIDWLDD